MILVKPSYEIMDIMGVWGTAGVGSIDFVRDALHLILLRIAKKYNEARFSSKR